jgi:hypothetical protein
MIQELEDVILTCDLPEQGLAQGYRHRRTGP